MSFKGFSIFCFSGHFIQPSGTILVILVEGYKRNISVKFILKLGYWPWGGVGEGGRGRCRLKFIFIFQLGKKSLVYFLALQPFYSAEWNHFSKFGKGP